MVYLFAWGDAEEMQQISYILFFLVFSRILKVTICLLRLQRITCRGKSQNRGAVAMTSAFYDYRHSFPLCFHRDLYH